MPYARRFPSASWARSDVRPSSAPRRKCNRYARPFGLLAARPAGHTQSEGRDRNKRIACSYATRNHIGRTCPRDRSQRAKLTHSRHIAKPNGPGLAWEFSDQKSPVWAEGAPPFPVSGPYNLAVDTSSPCKLLIPAAHRWFVTALMMNRPVCRLALIHELGGICEPEPHRDTDTDCLLQTTRLSPNCHFGPNLNNLGLPNEMSLHRGSDRTLPPDSSFLRAGTANH
jgi:hypothetical protein